MTKQPANISGRAFILLQNITAEIKANNGAPVFVRNPLTAELIAAGALVETAARESWTDGGFCHVMFVVRLP